MTPNELVKNILSNDSCTLYDRERIHNLFENMVKGYGKLFIYRDHVNILHSNSKSKKMVYSIPTELLTNEQMSYLSNLK